MNQSLNLKTIILYLRNRSRPATARERFVLIPLVSACFTLSPVVRAQDGGYCFNNTAEGDSALLNIVNCCSSGCTGAGSFNTAIGFFSLEGNRTGSFNTAVGAGSLFANLGDQNTATGAGASAILPGRRRHHNRFQRPGKDHTHRQWHSRLIPDHGSSHSG